MELLTGTPEPESESRLSTQVFFVLVSKYSCASSVTIHCRKDKATVRSIRCVYLDRLLGQSGTFFD